MKMEITKKELIKIGQVTEIRNKYKNGSTIEELTEENKTNRESITKVINHEIYPQEITEKLINEMAKKVNMPKLKKLLEEENKETRKNNKYANGNNMQNEIQRERTVKDELKILCRTAIDNTNYVLKITEKQKTNTIRIEKIKQAELIRKAIARGKEIKEICQYYKINKREAYNIINHIASAIKLTDELINHLIKVELKINEKEKTNAIKKAEIKIKKLEAIEPIEPNNKTIERINKNLKKELRIIQNHKNKIAKTARRKAIEMVNKNKSMIKYK